jgi:DNA-binding IclR family transcriptional regulator
MTVWSISWYNVKNTSGVAQIVALALLGRLTVNSSRGRWTTIPTSLKGTKTARTLEKGLMILSLFDEEHPSWTLSGISKATAVPVPTVLRLVKTMEASRYLHRNAQTRGYELGSAMCRGASVARRHSELIRVARPHLERLTELTTESTALGVWERGESLVVDMNPTPRPFKPDWLPGVTIPGLAAVYAKIAVAFAPESVREAALAKNHPRMTEHTITDPVQLREEIDRIRRERVAFGIETIVVGICTVGAPVFDSSGQVAASMAVVVPTERFGPIQMREHGAAVLRAATLFSRELGAADDILVTDSPYGTGLPNS